MASRAHSVRAEAWKSTSGGGRSLAGPRHLYGVSRRDRICLWLLDTGHWNRLHIFGREAHIQVSVVAVYVVDFVAEFVAGFVADVGAAGEKTINHKKAHKESHNDNFVAENY